jgi:hypothetical protein
MKKGGYSPMTAAIVAFINFGASNPFWRISCFHLVQF